MPDISRGKAHRLPVLSSFEALAEDVLVSLAQTHSSPPWHLPNTTTIAQYSVAFKHWSLSFVN